MRYCQFNKIIYTALIRNNFEIFGYLTKQDQYNILTPYFIIYIYIYMYIYICIYIYIYIYPYINRVCDYARMGFFLRFFSKCSRYLSI